MESFIVSRRIYGNHPLSEGLKSFNYPKKSTDFGGGNVLIGFASKFN